MELSLILAARALSAGDPLGALQRVALREDGHGLALRGIAMAQLGELSSARKLLRRAVHSFGNRTLAGARCVVALAEVALAERRLQWPARALDGALSTLRAHDDHDNVAQALLVAARRQLLLGQLDEAELALSSLGPRRATPLTRTRVALVELDLALRRGLPKEAQRALARATRAAELAAIPALSAEVEHNARALRAPAARLVGPDGVRALDLEQKLSLPRPGELLVDGCQRCVRRGETLISFARRPVLFALLRALAAVSPAELQRKALLTAAFGAERESASLRARLRVELGRLRKLLAGLVTVQATARGYRLEAIGTARVSLLLPVADGDEERILALLTDGAAWSSSALALALGARQRTVQRHLLALGERGLAHGFGRGPSRRFVLSPRAREAEAVVGSRLPLLSQRPATGEEP